MKNSPDGLFQSHKDERQLKSRTSRVRRPIPFGMFVLLWKLVILKNEYIKFVFSLASDAETLPLRIRLAVVANFHSVN
jgi:hypothetical protein